MEEWPQGEGEDAAWITDQITRAMSYEISRGHGHRALRLGNIHIKNTGRPPQSAHFWFQMALAARLAGLHYGLILSYRGAAAHCPDFTNEIDGDFKHDAALTLIPRHESLEEAYHLLQQAYVLHASSPLKRATDVAAEARYYYQIGEYVHAAGAHSSAHDTWTTLIAKGGAVDEQHILNNRFHWMRTDVKRGNTSDAKRKAALVMQLDPSIWRVRLARLVSVKPHSGVEAIDLMERAPHFRKIAISIGG